MSLDQIDDLCDQFEATLRRGESARIEDFLVQVPEERRPKLLRELLEIELELAGQQNGGGSFAQSPIFRLQKSLKDRFPEEIELVDSIVQRVAQLRQIGDYEILEELGHGGMGVVYKARQKLLNQTVAIKVLSQTLLNDPQAVGRFRREMQLIGSLNHPNIVRALNAGESGGAHYLVMEFVDGITLQRLGDRIRQRNDKQSRRTGGIFSGEPDVDLAELGEQDFAPTVQRPFSRSEQDETSTPAIPTRTPITISFSSRIFAPPNDSGLGDPVFSIGAACEAIRQAAFGLQHAHEFGLVHRDVKPANLMLDRNGVVKLLDLGLGKFLDEQRSPGEHTSLTMAGTTIGTIDYISPEQCENAGNVDIRADLYSLGCTFYFLLTGRPPYSGSRYDTTRKKLMAHIVGEIPKLQKSIPGVPNELEAVLEKMLAKEPGERFQTPIEVAEALAPFASSEALFDMLGSALPGGKRRSPGSTGKILGISDTMQTKATLKPVGYVERIRTFSKFLWGIALLILIVSCGTVLGLRYFLYTANIDVRGKQSPTSESVAKIPPKTPPKTTAPVAPPTAESPWGAVQTDLALLPGLNGGWWFNETPWYLPFVRDRVMRAIDESDDPNELLGDNPDWYYNPNIPAVQQQLWGIVVNLRRDFSPGEWALLEKLKTFCDACPDDTTSEKTFQEFFDDYVNDLETRPEAERRGVELHTRSLLEHQLATLRHDRELATTASQHYAAALERYRLEAKSRSDAQAAPEIVQAAVRSRRLEFLCLSDAARLEYLVGGNYTRALRKFDDILQQRATGERLGPLFQAELRAAHGALNAEAGLYDDSQFIRGQELIKRSKVGDRMHPLAAQLAERYAWSLLDQWKISEAEKQFTDALFIREANRRESKNTHAVIFTLHDWHGLALALRYLGNDDRAVEEYRKTLETVDKVLAESRSEAAPSEGDRTSGFRRYQISLRERAANTRERLADCTLYGGAASERFGRSRLAEAAVFYAEAAVFYAEAAEFYDVEGPKRTMRAKQAIVLALIGDTENAERILCDLDEQKRYLLGNQLRTELVRQVAEALLAYQKGERLAPDERKLRLRQFLQQFTIPGNPAYADASRRETLELRLFCAEFLVHEALDAEDWTAVRRDAPLLMQPLGFFMDRLGSRPFLRRVGEQIVRAGALLAETTPDQAARQGQLVSIVRLLRWMRLPSAGDAAEPTPATASTDATLVVFFLTENADDGFVVFYPQDGRPGTMYRLPLTRQQVKNATKRHEPEWTLDEKLVRAVQDERRAGRPVAVSWSDAPCWARGAEALTDSDWPFGKLLDTPEPPVAP